ncbi:WbqC family protein [Bacteroidales bacterium OttesenSCG-928-M11]|nr:WbqC family protein [Bacteroidales bacterium OttesenSCG-928-M11]
MGGDKIIYLSSAYLAPVSYYQLLNSDRSRFVIERNEHYIKQTYRNRCRIASANEVQTLSIPIVKPDSPKASIQDIRIADHANWRHLHWTAILSAYNSTPFFEYYADDFLPFYEKKYDFLFDFNEELRLKVCELLGISPVVSFSTEYKTEMDQNEVDCREAIHPKKCTKDPESFQPYYQVFKHKYGFQPDLSIIDLLFNMGPEAILFI